MSIKENIQLIRQRVKKAALAVGRDPQEIKIIVAAKTQSIFALEEVIAAGITDLGENRVQEAEAHFQALKDKYPHVVWHMIGHLQRNKVRQALDLFGIIQSVDTERLISTLQEKAQKQNRAISILIEINTSGEQSKYGVPADSALEFVKQVSNCHNVQVKGLMTMAPFIEDEKIIRPCFKKLKELNQEIKRLNLPNVEMQYLSMGMSDDFETAIAEGSNMVRIGRAIFGPRGG
ncbi:YggS family pyridoxal phosphate enzyme [candidate division WOR-1 bacterium RIFOXYB2_FULL_42_35]|uniref:Pyridoxal phosphate homeostasis protein n=1 Tax=candidate division WOR-1 bacterium RIFOXYC2_FULL_41_25 TaxID=1802586 RepID=A0A1F4TKA4_UNCSA|nr:MAG: YggS family pyridoxal phosphate enzyme [candidate division WOR-1 bacterium RIFOXYA2_FULL_41_14]OGC22737.1 MAG: YggS family pyridoxal phosphate enzyme [candidate division WOR-1 bacterium RIFOXYB2_FULL_42_35]OGC33158.1 MAG: YggS family pyridoxal phosphate enzyme [candidate division WOR-1 bacterium RIFOXYC2_FULL_41_25]OGC43558.1 MAG: YggS family pyridoxal phosphate enzyme [candidate division WOR-1 bacterium RIFOXYD2_FULL_41_8]